ncbi:DUF3850 domain-containing protein [Providencia sp. JGM181]|uniref:DUF3850 domain-containing protein n=1 Tax=unclassified Providencia TaxID=2633465 RepID=UPI0012B55648|nr:MULTISPECIES: DUF3850 domain-containing protein [unclassified Providencia]MBS0925590.1 DUF3850 domain-containing protein [Providencia sp. JGM181]MBS0934673.1 DUF3850 domain-containing protein [Providencia sp. JGM172]MBS0998383.1 DUF3850 domain-containing protein [Providencia sp. JGM178]MTC45996.1 DUF3850 domain-containing protein [Providencia sp. wls1922]
MAKHLLKIRSEYFEKVIRKEKSAEFQFNDRNFLCTDILILQEIKLKHGYSLDIEYTGREITCVITDVTKVNGVYAELAHLPEFVMLSFQVVEKRV